MLLHRKRLKKDKCAFKFYVNYLLMHLQELKNRQSIAECTRVERNVFLLPSLMIAF